MLFAIGGTIFVAFSKTFRMLIFKTTKNDNFLSIAGLRGGVLNNNKLLLQRIKYAWAEKFLKLHRFSSNSRRSDTLFNKHESKVTLVYWKFLAFYKKKKNLHFLWTFLSSLIMQKPHAAKHERFCMGILFWYRIFMNKLHFIANNLQLNPKCSCKQTMAFKALCVRMTLSNMLNLLVHFMSLLGTGIYEMKGFASIFFYHFFPSASWKSTYLQRLQYVRPDLLWIFLKERKITRQVK